jgi:hypothetical protein
MITGSARFVETGVAKHEREVVDLGSRDRIRPSVSLPTRCGS